MSEGPRHFPSPHEWAACQLFDRVCQEMGRADVLPFRVEFPIQTSPKAREEVRASLTVAGWCVAEEKTTNAVVWVLSDRPIPPQKG